jgi:Putative MetA-pathway of phenol degradation
MRHFPAGRVLDHSGYGRCYPDWGPVIRPKSIALLISLIVFNFGCAQELQAAETDWLALVTRTLSAQPQWITPVITVTPRLEQEFRYDISAQTQPDFGTLAIYGNGKGPEFIPSSHIQISVGLPSYSVHDQTGIADGWGDLSFLLKYRLLARNESQGNYILTVFLGGSAPTGSHNIGAGHGTIIPTLAGGKGFGQFSIQSTLTITIPTSDSAIVGRPISHNVATQYHLGRFFWPEFEVNSIFWRSGLQSGKQQVFATPGLVIGRIPLKGHLKLSLGAGFQTALTQFHTYNHRLVFTVRFPFN